MWFMAACVLFSHAQGVFLIGIACAVYCLFRLRLSTARAYVQVLTDGQVASRLITHAYALTKNHTCLAI